MRLRLDLARLGARQGNEKTVTEQNPLALELVDQQWAIMCADGQVMPTGTGQERTDLDASWENAHPEGHGACTVVVRESYVTPWRAEDDPAPVLGDDDSIAAELAALRAQVEALAESLSHHRCWARIAVA